MTPAPGPGTGVLLPGGNIIIMPCIGEGGKNQTSTNQNLKATPNTLNPPARAGMDL